MNHTALFYAQPSFAGLIGVSRKDITPPPGIYARNWGAATHDTVEGVHRPLTATALTIQSEHEEPPLVLLAMDLGWWGSLEDEWFIRGGLLDALKLQPFSVMMNVSHTHSGPSTASYDKDKTGGDLIAPYLKHVREAAIRATREAIQNRFPAVLSWSYGKCSLAQNRDFPDPETGRILCGFNPSRKADDTLLVGRVGALDGSPIATIVNYACHGVSLGWQNRRISPDFVGSLREVVESHTQGAACLFLQGSSGELSPREEYTGDLEVADKNGRELGFATVAVLESMLPSQTKLRYSGLVESGTALATWERVSHAPSTKLRAVCVKVPLPIKKMPTTAEIKKELDKCPDRVMRERWERKLFVRKYVGDGAHDLFPLWIWRVGDAYVVGQREEAYSSLQIELRRCFDSKAIAVMNLTNGGCVYLPPAELYDRQDIYQVWQTPYDKGSLEKVRDACIGAIKGLE